MSTLLFALTRRERRAWGNFLLIIVTGRRKADTAAATKRSPALTKSPLTPLDKADKIAFGPQRLEPARLQVATMVSNYTRNATFVPTPREQDDYMRRRIAMTRPLQVRTIFR